MAWALARNEDASVSSIKSELTLAQRLDDHLPLTAAALRAGELSADKARILARLAPTSKARCAALADPETGERFLLAKAAMLDVWGLAKAVRYWAYRVDPEADDKNYRDDAHRWELSLADTMDGTAVRGFLSPEGGQLLGTALAAIVGTPDKADLRTRGQRNADALGTLARFFLDSGTVKTKAGVRRLVGGRRGPSRLHRDGTPDSPGRSRSARLRRRGVTRHLRAGLHRSGRRPNETDRLRRPTPRSDRARS
jgi:hypothetical protein